MKKKVRVGDPLQISAAEWNRMLDSTKLPNDQLPPQLNPISAEPTWIYGEAHKVMRIGSPVYVLTSGANPTSDQQNDIILTRRAMYTLAAPTFDITDHIYPKQFMTLGVTIEHAHAAGELVRVAIGGIAWCRLKVEPVTDLTGVAGIGLLPSTDIDFENSMRPFPFGPHRWIKNVSQSGSYGAMIEVNGLRESCVVALAITSLPPITAAAGVGDIRVPGFGNTTDPIIKAKNYSMRATTNGNYLAIVRNTKGELMLMQEFCGSEAP